MHERSVFEKEVRRARKEAFKSSSTLVTLQEELRSARNRYTLMREEMETQRRKKDEVEHEAHNSQNQLAELQEQLDALEKRLNVAEEERDGLKMTLKEEEVVKVAAEGAIALPPPAEDDEFSSPRKRRRAHRESLKENLDPLAPVEVEDFGELMALKEDLRLEKRLRTKAEEESHFLKMECQFGVCSCRIAERHGEKYIHDGTFDIPMQENSNEQPEDIEPLIRTESTPVDPATTAAPTQPEHEPEPQQLIFSPTSGTFSKAPSPVRPKLSHEEELNEVPPLQTSPPPKESTPPSQRPSLHKAQTDIPPQTPRPLPNPPTQHPPRTISTTTLVPLKSNDTPLFSPAPGTPNGMSREEALEQIRLRRGRARSFAMGLVGSAAKAAECGRREISAPIGRGS